MHKVAVMGDQDSIYGYKTLGLSVFPETDKEEAIKKLKSLADGGFSFCPASLGWMPSAQR